MLRAESPSLRARLMRRPAMSDWRRSVVLFLAFGILLEGYRSLIRSGDWWTISVLLVAVVLGTCAAIRALGAPLAWLGGLIVSFVALAWIFAPSTLNAVLPTPSSLDALHHLWVQANAIMNVEQPPVAAAKPIAFVIASSFGIVAIVIDGIVFGLRKPVVAGALLMGLYVFPTAASGDLPNPWIFLGAAAMWLYLLRVETSHRNRVTPKGKLGTAAPTIVIAMAALGISLALPPVLPHVANIAVS
ncbi:MAG: transglutaminaseTgpA domain-containing protein, partial [Aeromicrobium sp.]